jgi:S1-C subfamily serine protease
MEVSETPSPDAAAGEVAAGPPPSKKARRSSLSGPLAVLKKSLCSVAFRTAVQFDTAIVEEEGESEETISRNGTGLVLDAQAGFVLTDRNTVPQPLGDIEVTLGDMSRGASVWFVHPLHSFVILRLDPDPSCKRFGEAASFEERNFEPGDEAEFIGYDSQGQHFQAHVKVQAVRLAEFPLAKGWREKNLEAIFLTEDLQQASGGVLCDARGFVNAIYTTAQGVEDQQAVRFGFCLPTYLLNPILEHVAGLQGKTVPTPLVPSLEVEFAHAELQRLRRLPVRIRPPAAWLKKLAAVGDTALKVSAVATCGPCDGALAEADLIVAIDGEAVGSVREVDTRLQESLAKVRSAQAQTIKTEPFQVRLTLLRGGKEREVIVNVPLLGNDGARRVLCWQGLVLQEIPRIARESGPAPAGVYISRQMLGSPAEADSVEGEFVVAVNGKPTPSLDAILAIDAERSKSTGASTTEQRHLRVETADLCGRRFVTTLEPDPLFWSTFELAQDEHGIFSYNEHECC